MQPVAASFSDLFQTKTTPEATKDSKTNIFSTNDNKAGQNIKITQTKSPKSEPETDNIDNHDKNSLILDSKKDESKLKSSIESDIIDMNRNFIQNVQKCFNENPSAVFTEFFEQYKNFLDEKLK